MNPVNHLIVTEAHTDQRIDHFLVTALKGVPKSRIYRAVRSGEIRVNSKRISADYRLQLDDKVRIPPLRLPKAEEAPVPAKSFLQLLEEAVIFEDKDIIIINKPSGVASHGGSGIKLGVIETFRHLRPQASFLSLVHRLDRETTGCMILAKKTSILRTINQLLQLKEVKKTYLALVEGSWEGGTQTVDQSLRKNTLASGERIVKIDPVGGKPSKTIFKPLQKFADCTLVQASPLTGRTHQIRVHAAYLGHPIVGDEKYGQSNSAVKAKHLLLHAATLQFQYADKEIYLSACFDEEFQKILKKINA